MSTIACWPWFLSDGLLNVVGCFGHLKFITVLVKPVVANRGAICNTQGYHELIRFSRDAGKGVHYGGTSPLTFKNAGTGALTYQYHK